MPKRKSTYTSSHRRYYQNKIRPFRKWKEATIWHQCAFCGMITQKEKFENPEAQFVMKSFKRWGRRFEIYINEDNFLEYMELVGRRALRFLQICAIKGLITREEIASVFDLYTEQKSETILPMSVISGAETHSLINLSQRKTHSPNKLNKTFAIAKPTKVMTIARTK
ncbi:hypothetical protein ES703_85368 [subsurface metagenome]